jgi:endonuclease/exonuclease/phosphatase family metal-dependent hydrolase
MKLKILSYNIHKGFSLTNQRFILHEIKKMINEVHADIVFLQEVQGQHHLHKKKWDTYPNESQFEYLADTAWPHYSYGQNATYSDGHHGNAILSKFPIIYHHNESLTLHKLEERGLLHAEVLIPKMNRSLHLFNTHINLRHRDRLKQIHKCMEYIKKICPTEEFIWGGDFNDWQKKLSEHIFEKLGCEEVFFHFHGAYAKTFPCFNPLLPLDRLYVRGLKIVEARVLHEPPWDKLSDHLAIYSEVEI